MKISIITPYKNSFKNFLETYQSVINQTYKNFEWIIVDDGSDAQNYNMLKELIEDPRVRLYKNIEVSGPGGARNFGLDKVSGQFLTFIDSDDLWEKNNLETMMKFIPSSAGIIFSGYKRFDVVSKSFISEFIPSSKLITINNILRGNPLSCLTTFIDLKKLSYVPKFGDYPARNDLVFFYRVLEQISYAKPLMLVLGTYNLAPNSVSRNKFRALFFQWQVCREVAKLNILSSAFNCLSWSIYGLLKYYIR